MFNVVFLVSGGEPDGSTDILVSDAYRWAFTRDAQYGYAAAYAVLIFLLLAGGPRLLEAAWRTKRDGVALTRRVLTSMRVCAFGHPNGGRRLLIPRMRVTLSSQTSPHSWSSPSSVRALSDPVGRLDRAVAAGLGATWRRDSDPEHGSRSTTFTRGRSGVERPGGRALFARQLASSLVVSLATAIVAVARSPRRPRTRSLASASSATRGAMRGLLATQMFPAVASAVPLYLLLDALHLLDSRSGLVLVYASTAVPFAIFQMRGAFETIPVDLEEAAMVDGATRAQAFLRVVLPAARPAIAVTALFAFMSAWNEFILAATLLSRETAFTLPVVLQRYVGEHDAAWGPFAAGAILVSVPVMALFYVAQRQLVAGLTAGGVKG